MVNINYEEYVERPGEVVIRPSVQNATIKEISEHYDKKWEFPRYRLTIEEILGEGEFGKVLKAKADGIGGNPGNARGKLSFSSFFFFGKTFLANVCNLEISLRRIDDRRRENVKRRRERNGIIRFDVRVSIVERY